MAGDWPWFNPYPWGPPTPTFLIPAPAPCQHGHCLDVSNEGTKRTKPHVQCCKCGDIKRRGQG